MPTSRTAANPFALLMNPDAVLSVIERSGRLASLHRHIYRPLDKPQPHKPPADVTSDAEPALEDDEADRSWQG